MPADGQEGGHLIEQLGDGLDGQLTPREIVRRLDEHIIGQDEAKRSVALAFRSRWRRQLVEDEALRKEITPKNILMVGPTGVGKTEIARRLARIADAPFLKTEATKFTEVGYVGRDVESIIRDLADIGHKMAYARLEELHSESAQRYAVSKVVEALNPVDDSERAKYELRVADGMMDDRMVEIDYLPPEQKLQVNFAGMDNMPQLEGLGESIRGMMRAARSQTKPVRRKLRIAAALDHLRSESLGEAISEDDLRLLTVEMVEQNGIVFIDEIDKIASRNSHGFEVSRHGVQRDLLPLVEGTTVHTKHGQISTTHILFIASGAFHFSTPSDLVPELQGRLPVRVNLAALEVDDFVRILEGTEHSLTKQYRELLLTEGIKVRFRPEAIRRVAEIAAEVNERQENIGARRLHTLMEKLVEDISFKADSYGRSHYEFTAATVDKLLGKLSKDESASRIFL